MNDYSLLEDLGLPSPQPDTSSPPAEDAQVTDVFYEDENYQTTEFVAVAGQIREQRLLFSVSMDVS